LNYGILVIAIKILLLWSKSSLTALFLFKKISRQSPQRLQHEEVYTRQPKIEYGLVTAILFTTLKKLFNSLNSWHTLRQMRS